MSTSNLTRADLENAASSAARSQHDEFQRTVEYLSAILDSSPDPVVVVDRARRVTYANPAVEEVLGWAPSEIARTRIDGFLVDPGRLTPISRELRAERRVLRRELEVRHRDGSRRWISVSASPLLLSDHTFGGSVAFLRDETERRRTRLELARKNAELEQTVRAVSHDLRSPLVAVIGFSRLLREDYGPHLDDKGRHFVERIEQAARTMEGLIRDFLELSRIGHEGPSELGPNDPREVLLQLQAELKPRLDAAGIGVELPAEPPALHCSRTRLYQIFANLIGNAVDHMGPVEDGRIRVAITEEVDAHHITVSDNGRGIDPSHHERIFEIFQVLKRDEGRHGTGIGLAIVRKIAEVHGGRAWVESAPGQGSCFHVTLARS